jgi:hypothetical protein
LTELVNAAGMEAVKEALLPWHILEGPLILVVKAAGVIIVTD